MKKHGKYQNSLIKDSMGDRVFHAINLVVLTVIFLLVLYPIIYVVSASFSSPEALMSGQVWLWPVKPTLEGYQIMLQNDRVWTGFANSFYYMIVGTIFSMFVTILAAYPLSRRDFRPRGAIAMLFAFTMWFNGGMIPEYLLVKDLHMLNTRWAMILPTAMSVWNMVIMRTYFQNSIAEELLESAKLDGCDDFNFVVKIVLPLSTPVLAVIALYYAVGQWNSFFNAMIYLQDQSLHPIQLVLRDILLLNTTQDVTADLVTSSRKELMGELLKNSLIVVSSIPMLILYPFVQKHFVKGIMVGSVKG